MAIRDWCEPRTGAVALKKNPPDRADDNGVLFTVVAWRLGLLGGPRTGETLGEYLASEAGVILRYPGSADTMSHDDMTAMAFYSATFARNALIYGAANGWVWPGHGDLSRIPDFIPALRARAGEKITLGDQIQCAIAWLWNFEEPPAETSGKQLIWLKIAMCRGKGIITDLAGTLWCWRMAKIYTNLFGMMEEYYHPDPVDGELHPIVMAAKGRAFDP